jgi:hypothetical protein
MSASKWVSYGTWAGPTPKEAYSTWSRPLPELRDDRDSTWSRPLPELLDDREGGRDGVHLRSDD